MKIYIALILFLLTPQTIHCSEKQLIQQVDVIYNARECLYKKFLQLTCPDLCNNNDDNNIFVICDKQVFERLVTCVGSEPSAMKVFNTEKSNVTFSQNCKDMYTYLYSGIDNEDPPYTKQNRKILNLFRQDNEYVQTLFNLYTKNEITLEQIQNKTDELISDLEFYIGNHE